MLYEQSREISFAESAVQDILRNRPKYMNSATAARMTASIQFFTRMFSFPP
jgi:hypothetical protein